MGTSTTLETVLGAISAELNLSKATEWEVMEEIRGHLEDAVADARAKGLDEEAALLKAAEKFGMGEVGQALQAVHLPWESADALLACFVPVLGALVLRWLVFHPSGSAVGWPIGLPKEAVFLLAGVVLIVPCVEFRRWPYTVTAWVLMWGVSFLFILRALF